MASVPTHPSQVVPRWTYRARQVAWAAVDLVLPPACAGCGLAGHRLCADCQAAVHFLGDDICNACGYPLYHGDACRSGQHPLVGLAGLRSAAFYEGRLQQAIHQLKYKRDIILADTLAHALRRAWLAYDLPAWTVVAVPLAAERLRERGYNQAALLARALAELAHLPYEPRGAVRIKSTRSQVGLSGEERRHNVRGAFRGLPERVAGRPILLVDDICTTGATLGACAAALRDAGASAVWGLTLARAATFAGADTPDAAGAEFVEFAAHATGPSS